MRESDLARQLVTYVDVTTEPVAFRPPAAPPVVDEADVQRSRRRRAVVLVAAALTAAAAVITLLASVGGRQRSVEVIPADSVPSTGSAEEVDGRTSFGPVSWTKAEGGPDTIPAGPDVDIMVDADGGYVAFEPPFVWRSDDALTWTRSEPSESDGAADESVLGSTSPSLPEGALPEPPLPATSGLAWSWSVEPGAVRSGDVTLIIGTAVATVPWEDYYGATEWNCGDTDVCLEPPSATWSPASQTLVIQAIGPQRAGWLFTEPTPPLAELEMTVEAERILFTDVETDELIHRIDTTPEQPVDAIADWIRTGASSQGEPALIQGLAWVSTPAKGYESTLAPWTNVPQVVALPDGGFAAYEFSRKPSPAVWMSANGTTWIELAAPAFLHEIRDASMIELDVDEDGYRLLAGEFDESTGFTRSSTWESSNGLTWTPAGKGFPSRHEIDETSFGYVATAPGSRGWTMQVSVDGRIWEPIETPPEPFEPTTTGSVASGGAGDVIWVAVQEDASDVRTLWIASFEE